MQPRATIPHLVYQNVRRFPERIVAHVPKGNRVWEAVTWRESAQTDFEIGAALHRRGVKQGAKIAILSETRHEWGQIDFASLFIGGIVVGVYPNLAADQIGYILDHSDAEVLFIENVVQLAKLSRALPKLVRLREIILIDCKGEPPEDVTSFDQLRAEGRAALQEQPELIDELIDQVQPEDVAAIVYTSGTTGQPKGVVLTHRNLYHVASVSVDALGLEEDDVGVVYLPLAHSLQRVGNYAGLLAGMKGWFAESINKLQDAWLAAEPTKVACVPLVLEKLQAKIWSAVNAASPVGKWLFKKALAVGYQRSRYQRHQMRVPMSVSFWARLADRLVFRRIRQRIFGRRIRYLISGGAPASPEVLKFFHALGLVVLEGYGLTETSAPATLNRIGDYKFGTVGRPVPGVEVKLAADGEILIRGLGNFGGYYKDQFATQAALTDDGWLRSGDLGEFDEDGFLKIIDRKKDLIMTAGGRTVAPQRVENMIKADPLISQVHVHGDARKYLVALITLDQEELTAWAYSRDKQHLPYPELCRDHEVLAAVQAIVRKRNKQLAKHERIRRFEILDHDFLVENGMLSPSLKVKRRLVEQRYDAVIDSLYLLEKDSV